jgi:hypothetical protein
MPTVTGAALSFDLKDNAGALADIAKPLRYTRGLKSLILYGPK